MGDESVRIIPVTAGKDWKRFVTFPYHHYRNDPNWVPHLLVDQKDLLDFRKHPFWRHADGQYFLAEKNGRVAGRIAAIIDHKHIEFHNEKIGFFGFFETINDETVAFALLDAAKQWLKERHLPRMRGPLNPSQNEECGLLIDAFDSPPMIMMTYNPPYYVDLIESYGLKKAMDLYAYEVDGTQDPPPKLVRVAEEIRKKHELTVRPIDMKHYTRDTEKVWEVYNKAWSKNWGFVPFTREEFEHLAKNMKSAIVPELALIAEIDGKPVGFGITLPDVNQALIKLNGRLLPFGIFTLLYYMKKINRVRIIILGVIHEHQRKGIDSILYLDTWRNAVKNGFMYGEMSWILESNKMMNRSAKMLQGKVYKTYRLYEMKI
ncbi:N-acetyltransferase [bacterium]|nr:N-acetyltransferase [bacterium]